MEDARACVNCSVPLMSANDHYRIPFLHFCDHVYCRYCIQSPLTATFRCRFCDHFVRNRRNNNFRVHFPGVPRYNE